MRSRAAVVLCASLVVRAAPARAEDAPPPDLTLAPEADVAAGRRVLATTLAIIPGVVLRGTGSYLVGDKRTGKRLLAMAGVGLGLAVLGGVPVGVSGANPYVVIPFVPMLVAGVGLVTQSWMADVVHAAGGRLEGTPRARTPWSVQLGAVATHDAYRDRGLVHGIARVSLARWNVEVGGWINADRQYLSGDVGVGYRLLGARATNGETIADGSYLEVRTAARLRDDEEDRVQVATIEAELVGRYDLHRLSAPLRGMFVELSTGVGGERAAYRIAHQWDSLLLGRFTWGSYLGQRGELQLFYDHRRDTIAGGIAAYRAAGFVGSVGASVDLRVQGPWAMRAELEYGGAIVSTLALRYQGGVR